MTEDPPPLLPEIIDRWGRRYVPQQPAPDRVAVVLSGFDLMALANHWTKDKSPSGQWRAREFAKLALAVDPNWAEFVTPDGTARMREESPCVGSA